MRNVVRNGPARVSMHELAGHLYRSSLTEVLLILISPADSDEVGEQ